MARVTLMQQKALFPARGLLNNFEGVRFNFIIKIGEPVETFERIYTSAPWVYQGPYVGELQVFSREYSDLENITGEWSTYGDNGYDISYRLRLWCHTGKMGGYVNLIATDAVHRAARFRNLRAANSLMDNGILETL